MQSRLVRMSRLARMSRLPVQLRPTRLLTSRPSVAPAHTPAACHAVHGAASFIDAAEVTPKGPLTTFDVTNPSTGATVAQLAEASDACVDRAIASCARAFADWRTTSHAERDAFLRRWRDLVRRDADTLSRLLVLETGKPLAEARVELDLAVSFLDWNVGAAARAVGTTASRPHASASTIVTREPVGVSLLVTPWNFPVSLLLRKVAMAVSAGCTALVKPSELTPLTTLALARSAVQAGAPPGLFNAVVTTRAADVVGRMLDARAVRLLAFTGSSRTGRLVAKKAADRVLRTLLELGGHAPAIVFDDADVEQAADAIVASKIRNAGQACVAINRLFVQRGPNYEALIDAVGKRLAAVRVGDGLEDGVEMGPLINAAGVERVQRHVEDAVQRGAQVAVGGVAGQGNFYPPTMLVNVDDDMLVAREETFGPVLPVLSFDSEDEVIARSNDNTEAGLAAYVFTRDMGRAMRATRDLEYGMIGVNAVGLTTAATPFGGVKESGIGREGGAYSLDAFTEEKYTLMHFP